MAVAICRRGVRHGSRTLERAQRLRTMCNTVEAAFLMAVALWSEPSVQRLCATPPRRRSSKQSHSGRSQAGEDYVQHCRRGVPLGRPPLQGAKRKRTMCNTAEAASLMAVPLCEQPSV